MCTHTRTMCTYTLYLNIFVLNFACPTKRAPTKMDQKKNIRIKDIAQMAGVSVGTVDRVLHNRGRISEEAYKRVTEVLNKIEYKPNLLARTLGSKKTFHIAVIIPNPQQDPYWELANTGIHQATLEWSQYGITIDPYYFDLYDRSLFSAAIEKVVLAEIDGILIAPIFYHEVLPFLKEFEKTKTPFIFFNTNIPDVKPISFIGQDLFQSGQVAADLMNLGQNGSYDVAIIHVDEDIKDSVHLLEKEKGFKEYLKENRKTNYNVIGLNLGSPTEKEFENEVNNLIKNPSLKGIFVSTSKGTYIIASILEKHGKKDIRVIGYDMLEQNLKYLKSGAIDFLINQNPKHQAFLGVSHLANHLVFNKNVPPMNLFPLEIITRQNLSSYVASLIH